MVIIKEHLLSIFKILCKLLYVRCYISKKILTQGNAFAGAESGECVLNSKTCKCVYTFPL